MAPVSQEFQSALGSGEVAPELNGESIVISGMSGLFPMSESVNKFSQILYQKVNPVTSDNKRWTMKHPEVSEYTGKVPNIDRFDSQFFMVHNRLGNAMDPMARKVLEHSYQAIYDAGMSPKHFNGKKVGVYIAAAFSEMENAGFLDTVSKTGYGITGCSKTMYANRISYWLNAKGPSISVDDACCGSTVALEEACSAINSGRCEAAIVGGANLCVLPHMQLHYNRCIKISPDGITRCFDENADGCAKSEAISVLFLQKAKHARRAYAEIVHVKNEFVSKLIGETGQVYGFVRNPDTTAEFLKQFYAEAKVSPHEVQYVEACGSADFEADKAELQAIEKVFCGNRTNPLLVGSVISNVGFTDSASGATAITKVLLGYHHGQIASNLHCSKPRQDVAALRNGQMRIVTEHEPFRGTYTAINSLSVTGVNSHVLLRGCSNSKDASRYATSIPRLVTLSARQKDYLSKIFEDMKSRPVDAEEIALLHNIHCTNISGHLGRGYIMLDTDQEQKTVCLAEKQDHSDEVHRPLWFVYSGMGSQWAGMGAQLMRIPIFAAAIERCRKVLEPRGVDIVHIITSPDKSIFDNVQNAFVGIAAIQIGLTDVLDAMELRPAYLIGHSVGELGCAYADGCLTAEEMILSAFSRGKASNETPLIRGAMAAIGLGYQELSKLCPPTIDIACHNSSTSSTISGPEDDIREFVAQLTAKGVFAKEVPSANLAYHSRYIADAAPFLLNSLTELIQKPRARSDRWLSTSVPQNRWGETVAKYCSAEYLTNNLLSSVLFEETSKLIPSNAVLVEIAPHGLLQAILKRELPETCKNIPLTQRGHKDNTVFFLEAIGKLYIEGFTPKVQAIYPKVQFPVSIGTPHLAHFTEWNHTELWTISGTCESLVKVSASCKFLITTYDDEHTYLKGNVVQGKVLYPFAGALVAVWDTLAMTLASLKKKISVKFFGVHLYAQPILHNQKRVNLNVSLHRGSGRFEVLDGESKVASGYIVALEDSDNTKSVKLSANYAITSDELYQHLGSRGYSYRNEFRSIHAADESLSAAQILWKDNWVTLIDGLIQLNTLRQSYGGVTQPTQFRELTIDLSKHEQSLQQNPGIGATFLKAEVDEVFDCTRCGGIQLHNLKFRNLASLNFTIFQLVDPASKDVRQTLLNNINTSKNTTLQIDTIGNLDSLHWEEVPRVSESGVKVSVEYAGINISDVKRAVGIIPFGEREKYYGMDFSGLTERGERVMGLVRNGAASRVVTALPELLWPVPAHWSLEEAATVPLAYVQAYYYLCVKNELQPGWRVLIHGATGALGQAAISVALSYGCQVFATVADNAKKRFLLKLFPQLNEENIGNSREGSFGDMVLSATNGEGCNIIISCVREDLKNVSLKCAAFSGVTIDMVQIQNRDKYEYGMYHMTRQRSYIAADVYSIFDSGDQEALRKLQTLISEGISRGHVRPLSRVVFPPHEAARAFRLLAASRHRGRVLLHMHDTTPNSQPRIVCSTNSSHLIICDTDFLGIQLADKLIARGAKKLRIHYLSSTSKHLLKKQLWKKAGIDIEISAHELTNSNTISNIIKETTERGPIEGIYYVTTGHHSEDKRNNGVDIIANLDVVSRMLCPHLKYFAVITDDSNIGKQCCFSRSKDGLPVTLLKLPTLDLVNLAPNAVIDGFSWDRAAAEVTERALQSKSPVLVAESQAMEKPSLTKIIEAVTELEDDTSLKDIGLGENLPFIKSFLRDVYHVALADEEILMLTKKKLLKIEKSLTEAEFEEIKGLFKVFSQVDNDELRASTSLIPLKTLTTGALRIECEINPSKTYLFILPGLEGHYARFQTLCEHLKLAAIVLQPGLDYPQETPQELARRYQKILLENFENKQKFYLLGYECGVIVALELASLLEKQGLTGTVYCLGAGPEETKSLLEAELSTFRDSDALQAGVARHMCALMAGDAAHAPDERALLGCGSWRSRVDACVRALLGRVSHSAQYARALLEAAYARIHAQRRYKAERYSALRSQLVLMRPRDVPRATELQRYSTRALEVHDLAAPLALAAADLQVPAIVNRYLDEDVLQAFDNSNTCETYIC